uniref:Uncharacterized protein n=1 Tax=Arundo donax TaxID=35708 RepID=A0A0A9C2Q0_ARUDO
MDIQLLWCVIGCCPFQLTCTKKLSCYQLTSSTKFFHPNMENMLELRTSWFTGLTFLFRNQLLQLQHNNYLLDMLHL